jgi:hypothetical protein
MRLACRRARPRDRELFFNFTHLTPSGNGWQDCFGGDAETSTRDACATRKDRVQTALFHLFAQAAPELRLSVFAVELRDETGADLCGTHRFTLIRVCAIAEPLGVHYLDHF